MYNGHIRKRKTKDGNAWQIVIELGEDPKTGKRERIYKSVNGTKDQAKKILNQMLMEFESGLHIEESKLSLKQYLEDWFETYCKVNLSPVTCDSYGVNINNHIIPYIGNVPLQSLKPMHVQNLYNQLLKTGRTDGKGGLSPKSVRYVHRNLRGALEHARKLQLVQQNVADLVTLPKIRDPFKSDVYDEVELQELLAVSKGTDMEVPMLLAVTLGLRRGELLGLRWHDVDLDKHKVTIKSTLVPTRENSLLFKDPKTSNSIRSLDIPPSLSDILRKHRLKQKENKLMLGNAYEENFLVCCQANGAPYNPSSYSKKFSAFLKKNNLKPIRLHDVRHSNATLMLSLGIAVKIASARLGHKNTSITMDLYSHVLPEMQKEVANAFEEHFFKKIGEAGAM